jgi:hypothetical protein
MSKLGRAYRIQTSSEDNLQKLKQLVVGSDFDSTSTHNSPEALSEYIEGRVRDDFIHDRVIIVDGWLLSLTEARQCALLSVLEG